MSEEILLLWDYGVNPLMGGVLGLTLVPGVIGLFGTVPMIYKGKRVRGIILTALLLGVMAAPILLMVHQHSSGMSENRQALEEVGFEDVDFEGETSFNGYRDGEFYVCSAEYVHGDRVKLVCD